MIQGLSLRKAHAHFNYTKSVTQIKSNQTCSQINNKLSIETDIFQNTTPNLSNAIYIYLLVSKPSLFE